MPDIPTFSSAEISTRPHHNIRWRCGFRCILTITAILWTEMNAAAQERLSMAHAVQEAIQFNRQLRASRYESQAANADLTTASLRPNPTLTVNADILPSEGFGPAEKNYGVSVNFPFELGGKRDARIRNSQAAIDVTEKQFRDQLRQTRATVQSAYFDFLATAERARVAQQNLGLLDSLVELSRVRVRGNDIAVVELKRSEVERERFALDVVRASEEHRSALTTLLALMGRVGANNRAAILPDSSDYRAVVQNASAQLLSLDSMLAIAERERPDIQALRAQELAAETNLALQHTLAKIDLNVSLDLLRSQGITYYGSTVSVPLPIYNQNQGEITKAEIRLEQSRVLTEAATSQLRADVTNAWFDATTKQQALNTLGQSVLEKAADVRAAVEYSYRRGGTSLVDFLDAARTDNELEQAYVDALQAFAKSLVNLNLTTGKDLFYDHS